MAQYTPEQHAKWRVEVPELQILPDDWSYGVKSTKQIFFQHIGKVEQIFEHPILGPLPEPWIFRLCTMNDRKLPRYYNTAVSRATEDDPRYLKEYVDAANKSFREKDINSSIANSFQRLRAGTKPLSEWVRQPIAYHSIRNQYTIIKTIDPGDGTGPGAMNGGIFVVKYKGESRRRWQVEKRFKGTDQRLAEAEIVMLHKVKHPSLTFFVNGFIQRPDPQRGLNFEASVYVEFCGRGSLEDIISKYRHMRAQIRDPKLKPWVPERFVWHVTSGLVDGLAYLATGQSFLHPDKTDYTKGKPWTPILHRDIKPDNVLLRDRDTIGSQKYFYCVLSDFGLAVEDTPQTNGKAQCGTSPWFAPELCWKPYPQNPLQKSIFPPPFKHSLASDLWAVGACIINLADVEGQKGYGFSHLDWNSKPKALEKDNTGLFYLAQIARIRDLRVPTFYSASLRAVIRKMTAFDPRNRGDAWGMCDFIQRSMDDQGYNRYRDGHSEDQLPAWATKKHQYIDPQKKK